MKRRLFVVYVKVIGRVCLCVSVRWEFALKSGQRLLKQMNFCEYIFFFTSVFLSLQKSRCIVVIFCLFPF